MASNHIYPTTQTRLAGEMQSLVRNMWAVKADADRMKLICDQIAIDGKFEALAEALGYATAEEAQIAYNLLTSVFSETVKGQFSQMIARMG